MQEISDSEQTYEILSRLNYDGGYFEKFLGSCEALYVLDSEKREVRAKMDTKLRILHILLGKNGIVQEVKGEIRQRLEFFQKEFIRILGNYNRILDRIIELQEEERKRKTETKKTKKTKKTPNPKKTKRINRGKLFDLCIRLEIAGAEIILYPYRHGNALKKIAREIEENFSKIPDFTEKDFDISQLRTLFDMRLWVPILWKYMCTQNKTQEILHRFCLHCNNPHFQRENSAFIAFIHVFLEVIEYNDKREKN